MTPAGQRAEEKKEKKGKRKKIITLRKRAGMAGRGCSEEGFGQKIFIRRNIFFIQNGEVGRFLPAILISFFF